MNFEARNIRFSHLSRHEPAREVFRDLSLSIPGGECVGILGREGSGKTTLLNILGGLFPPSGGNLLIDGIDPHSGEGRSAGIRLRMGFTFQFPEEQFLCHTVAEEFSGVLRLRGVPGNEIAGRTREALGLMGLDPLETPGRSPFSLSLGESRRLALSLLHAIRPGGALLDEPTAGMDASGLDCTLGVIRKLRQAGTTVIIATHDVDLLSEIAERVLILGERGIASDGKSGAILGDARLLAEHGYAVPGERTGLSSEDTGE